MKRRVLERLQQIRVEKRPVALVTDLSTGLQTLVEPAVQQGDSGLEGELLAKVREALRLDRSQMVEHGEGRWFILTLNPPLRLFILGAVHIAQALAPMAALAGYAVTVIDPRRAFANDDRFPAVALNRDWPDEALTALAPDSRTAVVALTHDPKLDDPGLMVALASPAFYVGALGSRKTHAKRLDRLRAQGLPDETLVRIHSPIGLDIGALSPAEIAVAILAQMTLALRGGPKHRGSAGSMG